MVQVFVGHGDEFVLLVTVDGQVRGLDMPAGARLYFNKTKDIAVPADEVKLTTTPGRAKISSYHDVAELAQIEVRRFFSAPPGLMVLSYFFGASGAFNEPVEGLERDFGEEARYGRPPFWSEARVWELGPGPSGVENLWVPPL